MEKSILIDKKNYRFLTTQCQKNNEFAFFIGAPDLQSKIRISKNSLQHDPHLKKSAPLTSLEVTLSNLNFCDAIDGKETRSMCCSSILFLVIPHLHIRTRVSPCHLHEYSHVAIAMRMNHFHMRTKSFWFTNTFANLWLVSEKAL